MANKTSGPPSSPVKWQRLSAQDDKLWIPLTAKPTYFEVVLYYYSKLCGAGPGGKQNKQGEWRVETRSGPAPHRVVGPPHARPPATETARQPAPPTSIPRPIHHHTFFSSSHRSPFHRHQQDVILTDHQRVRDALRRVLVDGGPGAPRDRNPRASTLGVRRWVVVGRCLLLWDGGGGGGGMVVGWWWLTTSAATRPPTNVTQMRGRGPRSLHGIPVTSPGCGCDVDVDWDVELDGDVDRVWGCDRGGRRRSFPC